MPSLIPRNPRVITGSEVSDPQPMDAGTDWEVGRKQARRLLSRAHLTSVYPSEGESGRIRGQWRCIFPETTQNTQSSLTDKLDPWWSPRENLVVLEFQGTHSKDSNGKRIFPKSLGDPRAPTGFLKQNEACSLQLGEPERVLPADFTFYLCQGAPRGHHRLCIQPFLEGISTKKK